MTFLKNYDIMEVIGGKIAVPLNVFLNYLFLFTRELNKKYFIVCLTSKSNGEFRSP